MAKKKKKLEVNISGSNIKKNVASGFEAKARNKKVETQARIQATKEARPHIRGTTGSGAGDMAEALPASEELKRRKFIPRTETNPEEFVMRGGKLVNIATAGIIDKGVGGATPQETGVTQPEQKDFVGAAKQGKQSFLNMLIFGHPELRGNQSVGIGLPTGTLGAISQARKTGEAVSTVAKTEKVVKAANLNKFYDVDKFVAEHGLTKAQGVKITKEIGFARVRDGAKILMGKNPAQVKQGLSMGWKLGIGGATTIVSSNLMSNWIASDNIMSGGAMASNQMADAVVFGQMSKGEALEQMSIIESNVNLAESYVKGNVKWNPALWFFGKSFLTNAKQTQQIIQINKRIIEGLSLT